MLSETTEEYKKKLELNFNQLYFSFVFTLHKDPEPAPDWKVGSGSKATMLMTIGLVFLNPNALMIFGLRSDADQD